LALTKLEEIVSAYIRDYREAASRELRWFASQRGVDDAVSLSAMAEGPSGKRLSHQRRIPRRVLINARRRLLAQIPQLMTVSSFEQLHELVHSTVEPIRGLGELYVYDTALRIGAKLGLSPKVVYLHAGTRKGAKNLGFKPSRDTISIAALPRALRTLEPREIEDLLCIYKGSLVSAASSVLSNSRCFA
jgi:hypothetical protein